jgi:hypothetical protein
MLGSDLGGGMEKEKGEYVRPNGGVWEKREEMT